MTKITETIYNVIDEETQNGNHDLTGAHAEALRALCSFYAHKHESLTNHPYANKCSALGEMVEIIQKQMDYLFAKSKEEALIARAPLLAIRLLKKAGEKDEPDTVAPVETETFTGH